jgi:hypothetical protein
MENKKEKIPADPVFELKKQNPLPERVLLNMMADRTDSN